MRRFRKLIQSLGFRSLARQLIPDLGDPPDKMTIAAYLCRYTGLQPSEAMKLSDEELVPFIKLAIVEKGGQPQVSTTESEEQSNVQKLFPNGPHRSANVVDLAVRLNTAKGTKRSSISVAREFTKELPGNDHKARRLLAHIRMLKKRGKLNL